MKLCIILAAVLVGLFRPVLLFVEFNPHVEASYQAAAHILVGAILGAWYVLRVSQQVLIGAGIGSHTEASAKACRSWLVRTFWILAAIEIVCAALTIAAK